MLAKRTSFLGLEDQFEYPEPEHSDASQNHKQAPVYSDTVLGAEVNPLAAIIAVNGIFTLLSTKPAFVSLDVTHW
jgi:hypothetical protein